MLYKLKHVQGNKTTCKLQNFLPSYFFLSLFLSLYTLYLYWFPLSFFTKCFFLYLYSPLQITLYMVCFYTPIFYAANM